jgi:hypothetical protein
VSERVFFCARHPCATQDRASAARAKANHFRPIRSISIGIDRAKDNFDRVVQNFFHKAIDTRAPRFRRHRGMTKRAYSVAALQFVARNRHARSADETCIYRTSKEIVELCAACAIVAMV